MKGQTYLILSIICVIIISIFAVLNVGEVEVNYLFWSGSTPLIFVILFSVLLGGILATIVGSRKYFQVKRENRRLQQQLKSSQQDKGSNKTRHTEKMKTKENQKKN
ncbi:MAG TPA: lipopolysaccharide assembly protein LapA domain-containing protein [Pseudogracilibacillus sp.]|nr:lipopolysaccharide assembly protein LapA domain-containing protein [Pseudogracilibacillus sp.]